MLNFLIKNKFKIILLALVLVSLWQLSFFVFISKWDNIDAYLPYRYFISDFLWNGHFPFWNSFQQLGTPVYSDLQSGAWYPVTWLLMLFGKYDITSLSLEIISCYIIAGFGFFKLSSYIHNDKRVAFLLAFSYALSGFMVGSSQLLPFLIGVAWLPWIIYAGLRFFRELKYKYAILLATFLALCTTGASPNFIIVLVYFFFAMFCFYIYKNRKNKTNIYKVVLGCLLIMGLSIVLLLPYLNAFYEFSPYFNRLEKLDYSRIESSNSFTIFEYISFLYPFSVISNAEIFNHTDLTLRNGYFGIVSLLFLFLSVFSYKNRYFKSLIIISVLSLFLAAGAHTSFYKLIYELPYLGVFRHPSFYRSYFILSVLLLAGFAIKRWFDGELSQKKFNIIFLSFLGFTLFIFIISLTKSKSTEITSILSQWLISEEKFEGSLANHLVINSVIVLILLGVWWLLIKKTNYFIATAIVLVMDLFIQTQFSIPKTVTNKISHTVVKDFFNKLPKEINQEHVYTSLNDESLSKGFEKTDGFWRNLSTLNKTFSHKGYNPMKFHEFEKAEDDGRLEQAINHNILYFENTELKSKNIKVSYNLFSSEIETQNKQKLILNQNYHHLWEANVGEQSLVIHPHNNLTMEVEIPANTKGKIVFEYKS
ncbi:MAG: YfhO family protein, partial [Vicingaceae bacterium]|nr:YfhO family protein [Vicingaceae bacterium]